MHWGRAAVLPSLLLSFLVPLVMTRVGGIVGTATVTMPSSCKEDEEGNYSLLGDNSFSRTSRALADEETANLKESSAEGVSLLHLRARLMKVDKKEQKGRRHKHRREEKFARKAQALEKEWESVSRLRKAERFSYMRRSKEAEERLNLARREAVSAGNRAKKLFERLCQGEAARAADAARSSRAVKNVAGRKAERVNANKSKRKVERRVTGRAKDRRTRISEAEHSGRGTARTTKSSAAFAGRKRWGRRVLSHAEAVGSSVWGTRKFKGRMRKRRAGAKSAHGNKRQEEEEQIRVFSVKKGSAIKDQKKDDVVEEKQQGQGGYQEENQKDDQAQHEHNAAQNGKKETQSDLGETVKTDEEKQQEMKSQSRRAMARRQAALRLVGKLFSTSYQREYAVWKDRRDSAARNLTALMDGPDFEAFLEKLKEAKDTCSIRTLEAFEMLDQLKIHAKALADEQEAQHNVLQTEGKALNSTEQSIVDADRVMQAELKVCEEERQAAAERVQDYIIELKELTQIADPEVRNTIAEEEVKMPQEEAAKGEAALLALKISGGMSISTKAKTQQRDLAVFESVPGAFLEHHRGGRGRGAEWKQWTQAQCVAYVKWKGSNMKALEEVNERRNETADSSSSLVLATSQAQKNETDEGAEADVDPEELTCEQMKENLQKEFEDAYTTITEEKADAEEAEHDKTCDITAHAMHDAEMVDLGPQREHATDKIEEASVSLAAVRPVYDLMMIQMKKMAEHVAILEKECEDNELVQGFLDELKQIIIESIRCPDMKDLELQIPETEEDDPESQETAETNV